MYCIDQIVQAAKLSQAKLNDTGPYIGGLLPAQQPACHVGPKTTCKMQDVQNNFPAQRALAKFALKLWISLT
jgi:hypothetical protein